MNSTLWIQKQSLIVGCGSSIFHSCPIKKKRTKPSNPGIFHMGAIFWTTHLIDFYWKTTSMRWWNFPGPPEFHWETQNPDVDGGLKMGNTNNSTGYHWIIFIFPWKKMICTYIIIYYHILTCWHVWDKTAFLDTPIQCSVVGLWLGKLRGL